MLRTKFFILLLLYISGHLYADNINLSHLTVKDGLLNSTVYFTMQDSKGFIWFCTETGVSRYDGKKFENFTTNDGLVDNEIFRSFEDSKGRIWFLSYNGRLSFYDRGKIYNSDNATFLSYPLTGAFLSQCIEDKWNNIWFSTSFSGVIKVNGNSVTRYNSMYTIGTRRDFYITSVFFKENDSVKKFILDPVTKDLYIQNLNDGKMTKAGKFPDIYLQNKERISKNFCDEKSTLFMNENDFVAYNGKGQWHILDLKKYGITSHVFSFLQDEHYLWLATDENGVFKIDQTTGDISLHILHGEVVTTIMKDNEKNFWFVTHDNGVFVLKSNAQICTTINTGTTFSVANIEWNSKAYTISGNNNGTLYVISDGQILKSVHLLKRKFNRALRIIPIGGSKIIIGCDDGLYQYDILKESKIDRICSLTAYKNYDIAPDKSIWVCATSSILKLIKNKCYPISNKLPLLKYTTIAVVSDSVYYIGTTTKLYKVTQNGNKFEVILEDNILKAYVTGLRIINGYLWVATHGNGIFIIKDDKIIQHIDKTNSGIVSDICQKLYDDGKKYVCVATNGGISVISRKDFKLISNINSDVGIASNDVKNIAVDKERIYAATSAGTSIFNLSEVQLQSNEPVVYVTGFKKDNERIIDPQNPIEFNYFKGFITISFTAITFQSEQNMEYEYKFAGESEWHRTAVTEIPFFSLSPGKHALMFRAKKYNSNWSKPVLLSIIVNPLWFQTVWFQIIIGFILLLMIYYLIKFRFKKIKEKAREENEYNQKIRELESKALISQMNPHFIFNSLNTVQQLILVKEEKQSLNYLTKFSMLMRTMLENSRKQLITLAEEIDFLNRYMQLESIRFNNKFNYSFFIDENLLLDEIRIPPVLLQPLLENAIKHGISSVNTPGIIKLSIHKENDFLIIVVEDNGIGIHTHKKTFASSIQKKESTAIKVLEERLKLIKNDNGECCSIKIIEKGLAAKTISGTLIELRILIL